MGAELNRRALLRSGGLAAAATAAAVGTSVVTASPAAADPLIPIYIPIGPERLYDSRDEGGRIGPSQTRNLLDGVAFPEDLAYCFNVTLTSTLGTSGYLSVFPGDESWNGTSSINWDKQGQTIANNAYTWLAVEDGTINVRCGTSAGGGTHFILDLVAILMIADFGPEPLNLKTAGSARADRARALRG
jgi:hypothetical protein